MTEDAARPRVNNVSGRSCEDVKRPACFQRQTSACRRCGLTVSQLCRGHEEPAEATRPVCNRQAHSDRPSGGRGAESVPSLVSNGESDRLPTARSVSSGMKRSTPTARLMSSGMKRSTPTRRTDVQRAKDQRQTPTAGLGPRTESYVKSVVSLRAACEGPTSTPLQQQYPRGRPGESESSSGRTRATGITHPGFLWSETLEKA